MLFWLACTLIPDATYEGDLDPDGDGVPWPEDCASDDATVYPGADEACQGADDDCDGVVDEGCAWRSFALDELADARLAPSDLEGEDLNNLVVGLPDVDADGFAELVSGHPQAAAGRGAVLLFVGATEGDLGSEQSSARLYSEVDGASLGATLAVLSSDACSAGEALVLGAPGEPGDASAGSGFEGEVYVIDTVPEGVGVLPSSLINGVQPGAQLGSSVAVLEQPDGAWLASGAPGYGVGGGVLIVEEPCSSGSHDFLTTTSSEAGERAGSALAALDIGGGSDALVVGAPLASVDGDAEAGRVYLVPSDDGYADLEDAEGTFEGGATDDRVGTALASGDLDGDGTDELVVGAPGAGDGGAVYVVPQEALGSSGSLAALASARVEGHLGALGLGWSVAVAPDLDGDGLADLALAGCPGCEDPALGTSGAWVVFGPLSGVSVLEDPEGGAAGWALTHDEADAGRSVAVLGETGLAVGSHQPEARTPAGWLVWDLAGAIGL